MSEKRKAAVRKNNDRIRQKILDATDNGRCWWLYQMLTHNNYNRATK